LKKKENNLISEEIFLKEKKNLLKK